MKVYLDKKRLQVSNFKDYMGMYDGMETPVIFETINDRWEVSLAESRKLRLRSRQRISQERVDCCAIGF